MSGVDVDFPEALEWLEVPETLEWLNLLQLLQLFLEMAAAAARPRRQPRRVSLWLKKVKVEEEGVSCAICLDDMGMGNQECRELQCSHKFHKECLLQWLPKTLSCPLCRFQIPTATAASSSSSSDVLVFLQFF